VQNESPPDSHEILENDQDFRVHLKKPPDKDAQMFKETVQILNSCLLPSSVVLGKSSLGFRSPVNMMDGVRLKKKKRRRKKKMGLLSRKNFIFDRGKNSWFLVGDYHVVPVRRPDLTPVRKKKKKKMEVGSYLDSARVKSALINRINLDIKCSGVWDTEGCELDQIKKLNLGSGQAKKVCLSKEELIDLFAKVSDAWDCFERSILGSISLVKPASLIKSAVPDKLPFGEAAASDCSRGEGILCCSQILGRGRENYG
jgi:hypothetical protein